MKRSTSILTGLLTGLFACLLPMISLAQAGIPEDTLDTPIDGGVSLLIAAGVGYGIKKVRDERKKAKEAKEGIDK